MTALKPLKVLIVEESPNDAELLVQELRSAGFDPEWQLATTEAEYLQRLQSGFNLVLSSYQTPQLSGLRALELLREGGLDVPFIVISNVPGEAAAVSAIKKGADDYLIRNQLARLGESVSQALVTSRQNAERRRVDQQLMLQGTALETAANAIVITDVKGTILWVNAAFTAQSGYAASEAIGKNPRFLKSGRHSNELYKALWTTVLEGKTWRGCFTNRRKDGALYFDEHTITPVRSKEGTITHFVAIMDDVTERKQAEKTLKESERRLREILENVDLLAVTLDARGAVKFCNNYFLTLTGWKREELVGTLWAEVFLADTDSKTKASVIDLIAAGEVPRHYENAIKTAAGELREIAWSNTVLRDEDGAFCGMASIGEDVTERKRDAVKMSAQLIELRQWHNLTQRREDRVLGLKSEVNQVLVENNQLPRYVEPATSEFDAESDLSSAAAPAISDFALPNSPRRALLSLLEDQKLAEAALRFSEERFRQVVESIREVFWMRDVDKKKIIYISPGYQEIWGEAPEKLYASPEHWTESIHVDDREAVLNGAHEKQIAGTYDETFRIVRPDGTTRWIRSRAFPVLNAVREVYRVVGVAEDITESKRAELQLKLQHAVTLVLAEATSPTDVNAKVLETLCAGLELELGLLWMIDRASKLLRCMEGWHGPKPELARFASASHKCTFSTGDGLPGSIWASGRFGWSPNLAEDRRLSRVMEVRESGLSRWIGFPIVLRGEVLGVIELFGTKMEPPDARMQATLEALGAQIGIFIERWQLAEQFRQAQKMEAIGTLAGGIAHDFNNVLSVISGYTELVKMESDGSPQICEYLGAILQGTERATDLVRQILAFSRREELERKPLQLQTAVEGALKLLRATIPATVEFETSFAADLRVVLANVTQVHQIVMNLCMNAAHAMNGRAGRLTLKLKNVIVGADLMAVHPGLRSGLYVRLSVRDTGCGMDAATRSRIFEPFFTTKPQGEGTGLGLSVVHGIMQSHDGAITVYSRPGEGTTFYLYFPPYVGAEIETEVSTTPAPRGNGQRILYVDDEIVLAEMGETILTLLGYVVETCSRPAEALALVRSRPEAYDLVVTDQMMPVMMGTDLAKLIHAIRADLPVILTTGFTAILTAERVQAMGIRKLLLKPLSVNELGLAIHEVLSEPKPTRIISSAAE